MKRPLKCIIADDEPLAVRLLTGYVARIHDLELCGAFTSATEAAVAIKRGGIDVAFLDIQMPGLSGLELASDAGDTAVVFVTAYRDYAYEGFRVHAADYLLKPVSFDDFSAAVARLLPEETPAADSDVITVRSDYRMIPLRLADILYVEGLKDYVKIYLAGRPRPVITLMNLKGVEALLPASRFVRVHRSFIVSLGRVESFARTAVMVAGTEIPVGDTYRARFRSLFFNE